MDGRVSKRLGGDKMGKEGKENRYTENRRIFQCETCLFIAKLPGERARAWITKASAITQCNIARRAYFVLNNNPCRTECAPDEAISFVRHMAGYAANDVFFAPPRGDRTVVQLSATIAFDYFVAKQFSNEIAA